MNKLFTSTLVVLGLVGMLKAASIYEADQIYEVNAASVSLQGPMSIKEVYASTGSAAGVWAVVIETNTLANATFAAYASSTKRSPATILSTVPATYENYNSLIKYGDSGLFIGTTAFFYLSTAPSGEANKLFIRYRK